MFVAIGMGKGVQGDYYEILIHSFLAIFIWLLIDHKRRIIGCLMYLVFIQNEE